MVPSSNDRNNNCEEGSMNQPLLGDDSNSPTVDVDVDVDVDDDEDVDIEIEIESDFDSDTETTDYPLPSLYRFIMLGQDEFWILVMAGILMVFNQVSQIILPLIIGQAYDDLVNPDMDNKMTKINHIMTIVLIIHFSGAVTGGIRSCLMGIAGERIVARLRTTLYTSILQQEIAFFDATKSGELVSRLGSDTMVVKRAVASSWAEVSLGLIKLMVTLVLMCSISPKLAGVTMGSTFALFLSCIPFGKTLGKLSKLYQEILGEAQNYPTETIAAMRTVQGFAAEERESQRYQQKIGIPSYFPTRRRRGGGDSVQLSNTTFRVGYDQALVRSTFSFLIFGGGFGAMYVTLWYGFFLVHHNDITLGQLTAFQAYIFTIGGTLAHISSSISNVIEARYASQRIFGLLDRKPKIGTSTSNSSNSDSNSNSRTSTPTTTTTNRTSNGIDVEEGSPSPSSCAATTVPVAVWDGILHGNISFENVTFSYPARPGIPVLKNFTLQIPKGKTTAIVGPSGAGKSTIISLLERFYDVSHGSVRYDGIDIRDIKDLKQLRRQIGYVQQEPTLFGLSLRENICYGLDIMDDTTITDEEIDTACRMANAHDFISCFPHGLDELVGERGIKLSGGQKQRIAIARAILSNPAILLLDEATSALDAESEFLVQQAMDAASQGRTVIVVAHRLSTIQQADQIVVMGGTTTTDSEQQEQQQQQGNMIDTGTHEELMNRCDLYKKLISRQSM